MKHIIYRMALLCAASLVILSCKEEIPVKFEIDTDVIEIGPEGGVRTINVSSEDRWVATVQEPWLAVSPANGVGSIECRIIIDSALAVSNREAIVRIENQVTDERMDFKVRQDGFAYQISVAEPEVKLASYHARIQLR